MAVRSKKMLAEIRSLRDNMMAVRSKKILAEIRSLREKDAFEAQYQFELEREGPCGIGAIVQDGISIEHWDGSETSWPRFN